MFDNYDSVTLFWMVCNEKHKVYISKVSHVECACIALITKH